MSGTFSRLLGANRVMLSNAAALVGATIVNSGLGVAYWWLAARAFQGAEVGLASAVIAAMVLLGTIGMIGLGTLLITEGARRPGRAGRVIRAAVLAAGTAATTLGLLFALLAPRLSADLQPLSADALRPLLFALGAGLTAATLVLDQALIGLLWGDLQFWRNVLFAV